MSGVPEIDWQHEELVAMLSRLNEAVKSYAPREEIYRIIDGIIAFTRLHFAAEERLMAESGYPELAAHREKHKQLMQDALRLRKKLDYVGEGMFTEWFNHWPFAKVLAHIQHADQQVEDQIIQSGILK